MQAGELIVTGKNSIHIPLDRLPAEIKVHFKDEVEPVPCNPHNVDYLEYEVHSSNHHHHGFVLVIKWSVSGVREIVWTALY
jgi:hypothetical protein